MQTLTLQFLGAAGTVTGSKHLLAIGDRELLVDCGLFQGPKQWRLKNWEPFPLPLRNLDAVTLTHAHLDHSGFLPRLIRQGFHGPVYCSRPTADLLGILLPDSGHLQEEDAAFANKRGFSKHAPALPLYTVEDAQDALKHLWPVGHEQPVKLQNGFEIQFRANGHILGSKCVHVTAAGLRVLFTGDLGRAGRANHAPPPPPADYIVMESTYGDRRHPQDDVRPKLAKIIQETVARGGSVIVPAFAVERTQKLLFVLRSLMDEGLVPQIPVHVDSPMAIDAVKIFLRYSEEFTDETKELVKRHGSPLTWPGVHFDKTVEESKAAGASRQPSILISASGMAVGGRVLHHLAQRLPDHHNTVLFVGFQAPGTRGRLLVDGAETIRIHGEDIPVRARIEQIEHFSDHADYQEMLEWLAALPAAPKQVFLVHGEADAARALEQRIEKKLRWPVQVPEYGEKVALH